MGYCLPIVAVGLASSPLAANESWLEFVGQSEPVEWIPPSQSDNPDAIDPNVDDPYDIVDEGWEPLKIGPVRVGGAFRFNYIYKDWDEDFQGLGELAFDTARINLDLDDDASPMSGSFEYRYYRDKFADGHDYSMIHHAWIGRKFGERREVQAGITKVPFGILPYASHNWFFQLPYYLGFEDDYDLGVKFIGDYAPWNIQAAYFARDEGNYFGDSDDSARYAYDLVREGTNGNAERDQFNGRLAYTMEPREGYSTEIGVSLMVGDISNDNPLGGDGSRYAMAAHLVGNYDRWNLMLQAIHYNFDLNNDPNRDASPNGSFVVLGAYDAEYYVASVASVYTAGLAYTLPVDWQRIKSLTFYNDFSLMDKQESDFHDSMQNVLGCAVDAEPFYIYIDLAMGKYHPWLGGDWTTALASGGLESDWHTRFNINVGLYF
ncbi:hypothetical protein [Methyloceanibacter sp.]|uniref:hypothetical protein n=1 Tax=Methyloceanibacter sp. TaxID=1965321 RepID=UPI00356189D0